MMRRPCFPYTPALIVLLSLTTAPGWAATRSHGAALQPFTAKYKMKKGFFTVAKGEYQLQTGEKHCYLYTGYARASGVVSVFRGDEIVEASRFCVEDGHIRPQFYRYYHKGGDKDHNYTLTFDWDDRTVAVKRQTEDKASRRKIPADAQDDLSMQIDLRRRIKAAGGASAPPMQVHLVTRNHVRTYTFQVEGKDKEDTDAGDYHTLRVARKQPEGKQIRFWFAPKLDYLPIRIEREDPALLLELTGLPQSPKTRGQSHITR